MADQTALNGASGKSDEGSRRVTGARSGRAVKAGPAWTLVLVCLAVAMVGLDACRLCRFPGPRAWPPGNRLVGTGRTCRRRRLVRGAGSPVW
jgi:hypothetical protein